VGNVFTTLEFDTTPTASAKFPESPGTLGTRVDDAGCLASITQKG
jgi:hypothetical protein